MYMCKFHGKVKFINIVLLYSEMCNRSDYLINYLFDYVIDYIIVIVIVIKKIVGVIIIVIALPKNYDYNKALCR